MSKTSLRIPRIQSSRLLSRVLDEPALAPAVRALPADALLRLVEHVGLEDAGELVALATTEQLAAVFDEDLFRSERPGDDERFDASRFLVWLEVLLEAGDAFVAERLAELPQDFVTHALHELVLVFDVDALALELEELGEEGERVDKALTGMPSEELDQHIVVARSVDGWDAILSAILALDRDHHELLTRILESCADMDAEQVDDAGGLYEVLTAEDSLAEDVAGAREDRRAAEGYVAPSAARSFLALCRSLSPDEALTSRDPVTHAYFRDFSRRGVGLRAAPMQPGASSAAEPLLELLAEAEVVEAIPTPLLPRVHAGEGAEATAYLDALRRLATRVPLVFAERSAELAYLANVLAAGCAYEGRRLRPVEALEAAAAACDLGLELISARDGDSDEARVDARVETYTADALFRLAWSTLAREGGSAAPGDAHTLLEALVAAGRR